MAVANRRKYAFTLAGCIYAIYASVTFIYVSFIKEQPTINVLPLSLQDINFDWLQVETVVSPKPQIRPTTMTDLWTKTDINTAYLKKVLNFHSEPECLNRGSSQTGRVTVAILLLSSIDKTQTRQVIRDTWANTTLSNRYGFKTIFILGLPNGKLNGPIAHEIETFNDILIGNFQGGARSSTLKLLLGLTWVARNCSDVKFVMYGGDHMFVNSEKMFDYLKYLEGEELVRAWHGKRSFATMPVRNPQSVYYVSKELYPRKAFPEYCTSEAGFILTMDAVELLLKHSRHAPLVTIDDVFVSIIAEKLSFRLVNNNAFTRNDLKMGVCLPENVLTARMKFKTADAFFKVYKNVSNPGLRLNCADPKLDLVLPSNVSNHKYFENCLKEVVSKDDVCFERTGARRDVFLMLLISSLQSNFERRQAIRETWGKQRVFSGKQTALLFTLATETKNTAEIQQKVREEDQRHGDIIQAEFRESFHNLTLKVAFGLKWLTENCPHAKYIYKGDDDMFVNLKNIIKFLDKFSKEKHKPLFMGNAMWTSVHIHDAKSKYHVSNTQYRGKFYPPYCSGGGYVISGNVIPAMYEAAQHTAVIPIDDAYHGILAKKIGVSITHNAGFKVFGSKDTNMHKCFLQDSMVSHKYGTSNSLHKAWANFTNPSIKCPD